MTWWARWKEQRARDKIAKRYGWVGKCDGCQEWRLPDSAVKTENTDWHWHLTCRCGHVSHWALHSMLPMHDPDYPNGVIDVRPTQR